MRGIWHMVLWLTVFVLLSPAITSANTTNVSFDPSYAEGPFIFWCGPYIHSFEEDKHYEPIDGRCTYSVPNTIPGIKIIRLYRGIVGDSVSMAGDALTSNATLVQENFNSFSELNQDEPLFAVIYDSALNEGGVAFDTWLRTGGTPPAGAVENQNYYTLPWKWGAKPPEEFDPVVIIPGILGSWEKDGSWVLDPLTHIYDNLVDTLLANGYEENKTLFKFPYDWHKSNNDTASILKEKISDIKNTCNCSYVDLVAHSMGGLVALQYISTDLYQNDVDQIVFLGTPMAGAPEAYKTWEAGEIDFGDPIQDLVMQRIFEREARDVGLNTVFDYIHSGLVSSIQELLPVYNYLETSTAVRIYPNEYPQNTFLENLVAQFGPAFHRARMYVVVGNTGNASTTSGYIVQPSTELPKWEHGEPIATTFANGDGTVPHESSLFMAGPEKEFPGLDHSQIVSAGSLYVFETLNNNVAEEFVINSYDLGDIDYGVLINKLAPSAGDVRIVAEIVKAYAAHTAQKVLTIVLYSPVDVEVIAPDGKRIGRDFVTGDIRNEIPEAIYSGPDAEHEYVIIPDPLPGEYKVKTIGTGVGPYTIATGYADDATTTEAHITGSTTLNQITENTLTLSATTTDLTITEDTPPEEEGATPQSCADDMKLAYQHKWIGKKSVYNALVADCKLLGVLTDVRDKATREWVRKGAGTAISLTLTHMDKLAKDKNNTEEARELIAKNTTWFREH